MRGKQKVTAVRWALCLFVVAAVAAVIAGTYDLSWYTIDSGGGTVMTGGDLEIIGVIGQPDAGELMTGGGYEISGGFLYTLDFGDCNNNRQPDDEDISMGLSADCNNNGVPDECEIDENSPAPGGPYFCTADCDLDCNGNGIPDACDVNPADPDGDGEVSDDCDGDQMPDECEPDCNNNGIADDCDIADCIGDFACGDCNGNGIPDGCDIDPADPDGNGEVSPDCDGLGRPDECDLAECLPGETFCDDCNLNGVQDGCDINPLDPDGNGQVSLDVEFPFGVPDECVFTTMGGDWTDPIWALPDDGYPDNIDSVPGQHVTVSNGGDSLFLNASVEIQTLRLQAGAQLEVNQTGKGDLTVVDPGGVLLKGTMQVANARFIDVSTGSFQIRSGGIYEAGAGAPEGTLTAESIVIGSMAMGAGGSLNLSGLMSANSMTSVVLSCATKGCITPPDFNIQASDSAALNVQDDFVIQGAPNILFNSSEPLQLGGDFVNHMPGVMSDNFSWLEGGVRLTGPLGGFGPGTQLVEAAGKDFGPAELGLVDNFAFGTLTVASGAVAQVADSFDNQGDGQAVCEALYVHTLDVEVGGELASSACRLYYRVLVEPHGSIPGLGATVLQIKPDFNGDGTVGAADLAVVLGAWGPCDAPCPPLCWADLNDDCTVGAADLALLLGSWGPTVPGGG